MLDFRHQLNLIDDQLLELVLNQGLVHHFDCKVSVRIVRHVSIQDFAVLSCSQYLRRQLDRPLTVWEDDDLFLVISSCVLHLH